MIHTALCGDCTATFTRSTLMAAGDALWEHFKTGCGANAARDAKQITQLPSVTFHEQALRAILTLAKTGRPFTIGQAHALVDVRPGNPSTDWPKAQREAEALGWIRHHGFTKSVVPTTKGSAVSEWIGTAEAQKAAA